MRVLFTSRPGVGHLYPLLPLARAARNAGHSVLVAAAEAHRADVEGTGLGFAPTRHDKVDLVALHRGLAPDQIRPFMFKERFADVELAERLPDLQGLVRSWRPDLVVHEPAEFAGTLAAAAARLPHATVSFGPMLQPDVLELAAASAARHWTAAGVEPDATAGMYTHLYLDICPPSLQVPKMGSVPVAHLLRPVPFGADGGADSEELAALVGPVVYFTLGTAYGRDAGLFRMIIEGIAPEAGTVIVTIGGLIDRQDLGLPPANVQIHRFIPQAQLLPRCDLVVTHGGSGSMLGAMSAGLPVLMLPQGADQFYNAERILAAGAGLVLRPLEVGVESVRDAVRALLTDPAFGVRARKIAAEIAAMPPPEAALRHLEDLVSRSTA